ncbi:MAG: hypothetical protein N4A41_13150 [Crocinitomicaceae bacterium]|jgi:hypothetical protein|nr:hypothetical protein [Crocinitomicaceae bacterium]
MMRTIWTSTFLLSLFTLLFVAPTHAQKNYRKHELRGKFKILNQPRKEAYSNREPTESRVVSRDYLRVEVKLRWFGRVSFHETNSYTNLNIKYNGSWKLKDGIIYIQYKRLSEEQEMKLEIIDKNHFKQPNDGKELQRINKI